MLATNMHAGLSSDSARTGIRAAATNIGVLAFIFKRPSAAACWAQLEGPAIFMAASIS